MREKGVVKVDTHATLATVSAMNGIAVKNFFKTKLNINAVFYKQRGLWVVPGFFGR